jgi:hypothetical protein
MSGVSVTPEKISSNNNEKKNKITLDLNDPIQARIMENKLTIQKSGLWMRRRSNKVRPSSR